MFGRIVTDRLNAAAARIAVAVLMAGAALAMMTPSVRAQAGVYPCNGDTEWDMMIGMTSQPGAVPHPLCVARPGQPQQGGQDRKPDTAFTPYHHPVPKGWKQVYAAFATFNIPERNSEGMLMNGYELVLGHQTEQEARRAVTEACQKRASSSCTVETFNLPYVTLVFYPDKPYFGSQRGTYVAWPNSRNQVEGSILNEGGQWYFCGDNPRPIGECGQIIAHVINGQIPDQKKRRNRD